LIVDSVDALGWSRSGLAAIGATRFGDLYTSEAVLAAERSGIFSRSWTLVASAEQIADGRYVTACLGGAPTVVWRDADGVCRAFHNLCRHRGIPLLDGEGPTGRYVTCPYHQWSFARDGSLVRVPQPEQFPDLDPADYGLHPMAVTEWHGMVFACPAPNPPDFEESIAPLAERIGDYLELPLVEVGRVDYRVRCNWKLLVENHVDVYHLWYLHQASLAAYRHPSFEWEWVGDTWCSDEPLKDPSGAPDGIDGITEAHRTGIGAHLLFPNLMVVTTADYLATYDARPAGPEHTDLTLRVRSHPDADSDALIAAVRSFLAEDVKACESLQTATSSPHFGVGVTAARHEAPIRQLHSLLRERLAV